MENAMTDKKIIYDAINSAEDRGLDHDAMITEMAADLAVREFVIEMCSSSKSFFTCKRR
jgi:hypothetical protein